MAIWKSHEELSFLGRTSHRRSRRSGHFRSRQALSEDGELSLSDGRTIVRPDSAIDRRDVVRMSSDFRLIVLANRPGYPFMGASAEM